MDRVRVALPLLVAALVLVAGGCMLHPGERPAECESYEVEWDCSNGNFDCSCDDDGEWCEHPDETDDVWASCDRVCEECVEFEEY